MNTKLLNTCIKSVKEEDGPEIVKFYKGHGFNTCNITGTSCQNNGDKYVYYGVDKTGDFNNRHLDQITNTRTKILTLEEAIVLVAKKEFPRVMLVSDINNITSGKKRVVFMKKNDKYIAWGCSETIKEAEERTDTRAWPYAWELEEYKPSRFPFKLSPVSATEIIDIACSEWQENLANKWGPSIILNKDIIIEEEEYLTMRKACTAPQNLKFDKIFGKDI